MSTSSHLAAEFLFIASGCSAYLWFRRLTFTKRSIRLLSGIVLWELIQLLPVHLLAGLQIAGLITRVTITSVAAFQGAILAGSLAYTFRQRPRPSLTQHPADTSATLPQFLLVSIAIITCSYLVFALDLFTSFPNGSDEIAYHLPLAVHWLQTGSLAIPPNRTWRFSLPGNSEIGAMLLLATGKESAVALFNWPALAALMIAAYLLAKRLTSGNRVAAIAVVLVLLSIPIIEFQAVSAYVDLYGTAFLIAAFALLLDRDRTDGTHLEADGSQRIIPPFILFLSAAACGISLGTKPIFWVYGAGYSVLAVFSLRRNLRTKSGAAFAKGIVLIAVGLLLPSAFWFGRATQATKNPVFPMQVALAGHVIFSGYPSAGWFEQKFEMNFVRSRSEWFIYPWTEWKRDPGYLMIPYGEGSGVGAAFAALVPIGVLFLIYRSLALRLGNRNEVILLLVLALCLVVWWTVLYRIPRYGLPILIFTCVLTAPLVAFLQTYRRRGFGILFLILMSVTFAISTFMPVHELLGRIRGRNWTRHGFYAYPPILDHLPAGTCVLNATGFEEKNYPLAGKSLGNCVVPAFEMSGPLTTKFLVENGVDYIAEIIPDNVDAPADLPSATLITSELVKTGETKVHWRVWKVEQP